MESQAISATPSPTSTPMLSSQPTREKKGKGEETGAVLTATNTIDTLTLNDQATTTVDAGDEAVQPEFAKASTIRKLLLLSMFTLAEFLDAFNNSALFPAIPIISTELKFIESETVWIISAYQLTFAAFLLVSGRISDVYTPKPAFIAGALILGFTHLGGGFTHQKIALVVLRALGGIGGALTIPSALSMIVQLFPEPAAQARAIALFGMSGAIGNILGVIIGALLVEHAGWKWIFWFVAIVAVGIGAVCTFLIPNAKRDKEKKVKFDVPGVTILTSAVILFIFAVTSGSTKGWGTAYVLAPLIISIAVAAVFFVWESRIPPEDAVVPPRMWRYRNFGVIVGLALLPYFWWVSSFVLVTAWWEQVFGWSAVKTAIHFLPMGVSAFLVAPIAGRLPSFLAHKYILLIALALSIVATILLPFGDSPSHYWRFNFPAFTIGSIGMMIVFANSSIAIFSYTPPAVAGTVGAVFNCALQLGSAVGLAAVSSISNSIDKKQTITPPITEWPGIINQITDSMWKTAFKGRASAFWFVLATLGVEAIAVLVFFKVDIPVHDEEGRVIEKSDIKRVSGEKETA